MFANCGEIWQETLMVYVSLMSVLFSDVNIQSRDLPKVRGYFAQKYKENSLFHNHLDDAFNYTFPKIQFRAVDNHPLIIGINEGIEVLKQIVINEEEIQINNNIYELNEKSISQKTFPLGVSDKMLNYQFISPWMALKEENYTRYMAMDNQDRGTFLNHLLRENFKTLAKGFSYFIPDIEQIQVTGKFYPIKVNFKNQKMLCFNGSFQCNFHIPDYLGLGKQSARGFGAVRCKGE
jgi:hypothetical protein